MTSSCPANRFLGSLFITTAQEQQRGGFTEAGSHEGRREISSEMFESFFSFACTFWLLKKPQIQRLKLSCCYLEVVNQIGLFVLN